MNYPSVTFLKVKAKMAEKNRNSVEKQMIKTLLEKTFGHVAGINVIHQNGEMIAVTFAAKNKGNRHFAAHKAGVRQTEGRIELLEVVNT